MAEDPDFSLFAEADLALARVSGALEALVILVSECQRLDAVGAADLGSLLDLLAEEVRYCAMLLPELRPAA